MSTLFDSYYDSFGHELHIGDNVMFKVKDRYIIGSLAKFGASKSGALRYTVVPSAIYKTYPEYEDLKRSYNVSDKNIYLIRIKKKTNVEESN